MIGARGRSKHGNVAVVVDGIRFASKREAARWGELQLLERTGKIQCLNRQVRIPLQGKSGKTVAHYVADFTYSENGKMVVEDVKSKHSATLPSYRRNKRHLFADYGYVIREVF